MELDLAKKLARKVNAPRNWLKCHFCGRFMSETESRRCLVRMEVKDGVLLRLKLRLSCYPSAQSVRKQIWEEAKMAAKTHTAILELEAEE